MVTIAKHDTPRPATLDVLTLPGLTDADICFLIDFAERFVGTEYMPFAEWFIDVLMIERQRRMQPLAEPAVFEVPFDDVRHVRAGLLCTCLLLDDVFHSPHRSHAARRLVEQLHRSYVLAGVSFLKDCYR